MGKTLKKIQPHKWVTALLFLPFVYLFFSFFVFNFLGSLKQACQKDKTKATELEEEEGVVVERNFRGELSKTLEMARQWNFQFNGQFEFGNLRRCSVRFVGQKLRTYGAAAVIAEEDKANAHDQITLPNRQDNQISHSWSWILLTSSLFLFFPFLSFRRFVPFIQTTKISFPITTRPRSGRRMN